MTLAALRIETRAAERERLLLLAAIAGCVSLTARGISWRAIAITVAVGVAAWLAPTREDPRASFRTCAFAVALGVGAFVVVRLRLVVLPYSGTMLAGAASVVGAVAEEIFFRRLVYDALERWGAPVAIAGAAVAFAAVHVPAYGFAVLPIDLAAGLILGWQRWTTRTVTVPAVTHVAANVLSIL
jgi:membrane protease YdiL (CAAX protease family)